MSDLGHNQTWRPPVSMSALSPKADIDWLSPVVSRGSPILFLSSPNSPHPGFKKSTKGRCRQQRRAIPTLQTFVNNRYLPFVKTYKRSWQTDETILRVHVLPLLGHLYLDEITTSSISELVASMRSDNMRRERFPAWW